MFAVFAISFHLALRGSFLSSFFSFIDRVSQALFNSLPTEDYKDGVLVLGGDGRYFNREAAQVSFR